MLRYREFDNINKAFTAAIAEEKALRLSYKENSVRCKNHTTANCYRNNSNPATRHYNNLRTVHINQAPFTLSNFPSQPRQDSQCRYCKHLVTP